MEPKHIVVVHNGNFYRVRVDSQTGLVIDPVNMFKPKNKMTKEEVMEFHGREEDR